ncbi:MAG: hypothetical protein ACOZE5_11265 [Verrucomicrobiota bacterium]
MKTPLTAVIAGTVLWLLYMLFGGVDVAFAAIILFGTGIVAWTVEQYGHRHHH